MNKIEWLIYKLKNGNTEVQAAALFDLVTADIENGFNGYSGYNQLTQKGGILQVHSNDLNTMVIIWRKNETSFLRWNAHIVEGLNSNEPKTKNIQVKLDRQDSTFLKSFIMFNSMEAL